MSVKFIILGTGSSMGIPRADGYSGVCDMKNIKNHRSRCSALIRFNNENFLIDTSPDLRQQLINNKIRSISKVFYSHLHADQTHGINDLRPFFLTSKKQIPIYADNKTSKYLNSTFAYCFKSSKDYPSTLCLNILKKIHTFRNGKNKIIIQSIPAKHGNIESICYLINKKLAYASDVSFFYKKDLKYLFKLDYLIVDCLWYKNHYAHFNLSQILNLVKKINPKKTILTNMHSDFDYNKLKKELPKNIVPGYDGMVINL
ncbi:MBL fold metallo-hydrolase [Candidatus Pelagibacter sp.]|jgi:phosphoribosyl 1,2-cyclic phosphate phosphodiesterase|nr:MBL fold metallo-hydrolase [Candidatus Pelagibacter sp.]